MNWSDIYQFFVDFSLLSLTNILLLTLCVLSVVVVFLLRSINSKLNKMKVDDRTDPQREFSTFHDSHRAEQAPPRPTERRHYYRNW